MSIARLGPPPLRSSRALAPTGWGFRAPAFILSWAARFSSSSRAALSFALPLVAQERQWCDHDYPRWGGHTTECTTHPSRARRTGFYDGVGAFSLLGSGPFALPRPEALSPLPTVLPVWSLVYVDTSKRERAVGADLAGGPGPIEPARSALFTCRRGIGS